MNSRLEPNDGAGSLSRLRARNRTALLDALTAADALSQTELSERTGLAAATVSNLIAELQRDGEVDITHGVRNGRRANLVSRRVDAQVVSVGLSVSRDAIVAVSVRADGAIEERRSVVRPAAPRYDDDLAVLAELVGEVAGDARVVAVGLAVGITVDVVRGMIAVDGDPLEEGIVPGFPGAWQGSDVAADLAARIAQPVVLLNDGDAGALAEARVGAARGASEVLYVQLAPGVGGGLVIGDRLYRGGEGGIAAEIGHLSSDPDGPLCICGSRGCLEPLFSDVLLELARPVLGENVTHAQIADLASRGDPAASRLLREMSTKLMAGLVNPITFITPAKVVLGGELAAAGDALLGPVTDAARHTAASTFWRGEIVLGEFGLEAPAVGAALYAEESRISFMA